jgi:hypothetical protein
MEGLKNLPDAPKLPATPPPPPPSSVSTALINPYGPGAPPAPKPPTAGERLAALQPPANPATDPSQKPNWARRLLANIVGGVETFQEATGRLQPGTAQAERSAILYPKYGKQRAAYEQQRADLEEQQKVEDQDVKTRAQAEQAAATAEQRAGANQTRVEVAQANADRAKADRAQKAFQALVQGRPVVYRSEGEAGPDGWDSVPADNPDVPGMKAYVPAAITPLPKELVDYVPGKKEGDLIDSATLAQASKTYRQEIERKAEQDNKPDKEVADPRQVLLNPKNHTPEQVRVAQTIFDQEHRDPNAIPGGGPAPARNPALPAGERDDSALAGMDAGAQSVVKQLVDYKYPLPTGIALSKPYWQNMLQRAAQYDPSFDASQYQIRQKLRNDFASGKSAQAINSLNTVAQHIDRLEQNWEALGNFGGLATLANRPVNWAESTVGGDPRVNTFEMDQQAVANELMRTWRQVGADESEIKNWSSKLSPNASPATQQAAIREVYELVRGKLAALKNQYESGMGRPADFHILQSDTRKRFEAHGVNVDDLTPGSTYQQPPAPAGKPKASDFWK